MIKRCKTPTGRLTNLHVLKFITGPFVKGSGKDNMKCVCFIHIFVITLVCLCETHLNSWGKPEDKHSLLLDHSSHRSHFTFEGVRKKMILLMLFDFSRKSGLKFGVRGMDVGHPKG